MAFVDAWNNTISDSSTLIGYRGDVEEFPHELYSFLLSSIRNADLNDVALLWRFLKGMQDTWEVQYAKILSLPTLFSPEECAEKYLEYLRKQVGILDDLAYLWGTLSVIEKRKLIKYFVRFLSFRSTGFGLREILETMAGRRIFYFGYFFFRWIISGDLDTETETALGRDDEGFDPWLLGEHSMPVGIRPDSVAYTAPPDSYYVFEVTTLVNELEEPYFPSQVLVTCIPTATTRFGTLSFDDTPPGYWYVTFLPGELFGQTVTEPTDDINDFRVGFDLDTYTSDILIVDNGDLNRDMIVGLVKFSRAISERLYIRYYYLLETFETGDFWSTTGSVVFQNNTAIITNAGTLTLNSLEYGDPYTWQNYCMTIKMKQSTNIGTTIRFMTANPGDYYNVYIVSNPIPNIPAGLLYFQRKIGGSNTTLLSNIPLDHVDPDVYYTWRIECFTSERPGGDVQVTRFYQDENLLFEYVDNPVPWTTAQGTIGLITAGGAVVTVSRVTVNPLPTEFDYIGP